MAKQVKHHEPEDETDAFDEMYGSNYYGADDVKKTFTADVATVEQEAFKDDKKGGEKKKLVVTLAGVRKPIILNKTNARVLAEAFGKVPRLWVGKPVTVKVEQTSYQGRSCKGLRLYPALDH
jgi:hypothetical protein